MATDVYACPNCAQGLVAVLRQSPRRPWRRELRLHCTRCRYERPDDPPVSEPMDPTTLFLQAVIVVVALAWLAGWVVGWW